VNDPVVQGFLKAAGDWGDQAIGLSGDLRRLLERWSDRDVVDDWERERSCRIEAIQSWPNPYVR
jgi:endonuclease I